MPSLNFLPHPAHYHLHSSSTTSPTTIVFLLRRKPNSRSNIRTHSQTLTPPMFSQFSTTSEGFSNASSLLFRIGTDAHLYDDPDDTTIPQLFDSRFDSEKVETLKRLLALIAQGADVVKNVASQSLEVKKLVYLYLLHYAEKRPNEALLSINCFQKDLSDTNPLGSVSLVGVMLSHNSPGVVGAPAVGFKFVCPNNLPLIGKSFRRLCETLPDVEEWGQIVLIEILLRYVVARHGFVRESIMCASQSDKDSMGVGHILDIFANGVDADAQTSCQNDDVKMLLRCTLPLLWSQNSSVVVAAAGVHWIMAPMEEVKRTVNPLLFVLRFSQASKYVEKKLKS